MSIKYVCTVSVTYILASSYHIIATCKLYISYNVCVVCVPTSSDDVQSFYIIQSPVSMSRRFCQDLYRYNTWPKCNSTAPCVFYAFHKISALSTRVLLQCTYMYKKLRCTYKLLLKIRLETHILNSCRRCTLAVLSCALFMRCLFRGLLLSLITM